MQSLIQHLNDYAMALLVASVAVSSVIQVLHLEKTAVGSRVVAGCFDLIGMIRGYQSAHQSKPEAK